MGSNGALYSSLENGPPTQFCKHLGSLIKIDSRGCCDICEQEYPDVRMFHSKGEQCICHKSRSGVRPVTAGVPGNVYENMFAAVCGKFINSFFLLQRFSTSEKYY